MIAPHDYYKLYWPLLEQENCLTIESGLLWQKRFQNIQLHCNMHLLGHQLT